MGGEAAQVMALLVLAVVAVVALVAVAVLLKHVRSAPQSTPVDTEALLRAAADDAAQIRSRAERELSGVRDELARLREELERR